MILCSDFFTGTSYGPKKLVYNGSALEYTDKDSNLLPFTDYQYSVTALNRIGKVSSLWELVTTKEAPPDTVPAPAIEVSFEGINFIFLILMKRQTELQIDLIP